MFLQKYLYNEKRDFPQIVNAVTTTVLRSGLLLDEHEFQILSNSDYSNMTDALLEIPSERPVSVFHYVLNYILYRTMRKKLFIVVYTTMGTLISELAAVFVKHLQLNKSVKKHFKKRILQLTSLPAIDSLLDSMLLQHEMTFLEDYCTSLIKVNAAIVDEKKAILSSFSDLDSTEYLIMDVSDDCKDNGSLYENLEKFDKLMDIYIYNSSEYLNALTMSLLLPFRRKCSYSVNLLQTKVPQLTKCLNTILSQQSERFAKIQYCCAIKDNVGGKHTNDPTNKRQNLITHNISEVVSKLQIVIQIAADLHLDVNRTNKVPFDAKSLSKLSAIRLYMKTSLDNIDYLEKLMHSKKIKTSSSTDIENNQPLLKGDNCNTNVKVITADEEAVNGEDEVFSCYVDDEYKEPVRICDYDDLYESYAAQKLLISELQEKLDALTSLKSRKIAPSVEDQILPRVEAKRGTCKLTCMNTSDHDRTSEDLSVSIPALATPFEGFPQQRSDNLLMTRISVANQIRVIAAHNKREEECFGTGKSSSDTDDSAD